MTTFVTGGTSSIGRVLVKELSRQGESVRLLARPNSDRSGLDLPGVTFVPGDVTDTESVRRGMAGCERVSHLAAIVGHDVPEATWWKVNRDGACNVLQAALDLGVTSMVQVSSISVLGWTQPGETADESRPVDTSRYLNLYQKTKHAADEAAREYAGRGLNVKIVYPSFGYGCSRATSHPSLQDQTLLRMAAGQPVAVMGSGKNLLTLSYYRDTARGILLAHERGLPGDDYILGGEVLTFPQLWAAVAAVLGKQPPTRRIPLGLLKLVSGLSHRLTGKRIFPDDFFDMISLNWSFSSAKAVRVLGWAYTPFQDGIAETWQEYQRLGWQPGKKI